MVCRDAGLFQGRLVALDGSKFRAVASRKKVIGRRQIAEEAAHLDRRISEFLAGLDTADGAEPDDAPNAVASALSALKERRVHLDRLAAKLCRTEQLLWMARKMLGPWDISQVRRHLATTYKLGPGLQHASGN